MAYCEVCGYVMLPSTNPSERTEARVRREATPAQQEQLGMAIRSLPAFAPLPRAFFDALVEQTRECL